ncbi:MAG: XRE family transcriptional regulator [Hapalosiphonaceae cyanobacterium JJU2]|nr:MAG: XRE family transcriptional regulator [Hapalosiphonaceae cyanobacterium JJU2]
MQERQKRLAQLIEQLLQEGWTQTTLSEALSVDFTTVYRWLKGKTVPEADSKNFQRLAKVTGGDSASLQLYLDGEISLLAYRQSLEEQQVEDIKKRKSLTPEQIKREVLAQIYLLDPADIAEVISTSVAFLAKQA